jgi:hypothetical protein
MTKKILNVRICNQCGKEQICEGAPFGNPFSGWITLTHIEPLYVDGQEEGMKDFCSDECLKKHVNKLKAIVQPGTIISAIINMQDMEGK